MQAASLSDVKNDQQVKEEGVDHQANTKTDGSVDEQVHQETAVVDDEIDDVVEEGVTPLDDTLPDDAGDDEDDVDGEDMIVTSSSASANNNNNHISPSAARVSKKNRDDKENHDDDDSSGGGGGDVTSNESSPELKRKPVANKLKTKMPVKETDHSLVSPRKKRRRKVKGYPWGRLPKKKKKIEDLKKPVSSND